MFGFIWKSVWKLSGWKIAGQFPRQHKKMVIIVAPHTSWKDIFVGFAARNELKIYNAKFLGKKELFDGPFGWLFKWLGGTPVDRSSKHGMVDQVADLFNNKESFILGLSPEGTRRRVDRLRSGFYHIAKKAVVPILPVGFDFENKKLIIGDLLMPGNDETADMKKLINFFATIKGANPDNDLRHLFGTV
jgi:1-acyl-sn-glycerol-3-phosphate acyltransferase